MVILVVDDDPSLLKLIKSSLEGAGYSVIGAQSYDAALSAISNNGKLDLALVDFWLDGEDAVSLFDKLQEHHPGIPIVMMSGGSGSFPIESSDAVARISGAREFLQKPFPRETLLTTIQNLLPPT